MTTKKNIQNKTVIKTQSKIAQDIDPPTHHLHLLCWASPHLWRWPHSTLLNHSSPRTEMLPWPYIGAEMISQKNQHVSFGSGPVGTMAWKGTVLWNTNEMGACSMWAYWTVLNGWDPQTPPPPHAEGTEKACRKHEHIFHYLELLLWCWSKNIEMESVKFLPYLSICIWCLKNDSTQMQVMCP